jgi:hypothetical protein
MAMTATHGNHGQLILTSTPNVSMTDQALVDSGDHTTFNISNAADKRYWDRTAAFVFQTSTDGSTWNTAVPANVQYVGGIVTFSGAVGGTHQARIHSGAYLPYSAIGDVKEWGFDISRKVHESTCMTTTNTPTRWETYKGGLAGGTFKIARFLVDATYINLVTVATDDTLIASLVLDVTATPPTRLESFGKLTKDGAKVPLNDLELEDLDFSIDGQMYLVNS